MRRLNVHLTEPQSRVFNSKARAVAAVAGFGAGKSQVAMYRLIATMLQYPAANMLYTAPTAPLIRDIFWPKLNNFLPSINVGYYINKSEGIVYIKGHGKIFCRSMDTPDRIVGFEVLDAYLDELDILTTDKALNVVRKCKARMRQKVYSKQLPNQVLTKKEIRKSKRKKSQLYVTTTPEGYKATYKLFKEKPLPNSELIQMSTYSNPHLPDDYIDDLLKTYPQQLIKAYLQGEFVNLANRPVWYGYKPDLHDTTTSVNIVDSLPLIIGMDFNVGRGCSVIYQPYLLPIGHPNNPTQEPLSILVSVDEIINTQDTPETISILNERFPAHIYRKRTVYPDASGGQRKSVNASFSDISLLKQGGFMVKQHRKNPPIKDRIAAVNAAFLNAKNVTRLYIQKQKTPFLSAALIKQTYNINGLPEKGTDKGDDITDAGSYPVEYLFPIKSRRMFTQPLGGL